MLQKNTPNVNLSMRGTCPICNTKGRVTGKHCKHDPNTHIYFCGNSNGLPVAGFNYLGPADCGHFERYKDSKYFVPGDGDGFSQRLQILDLQAGLGDVTADTLDNSKELKAAIGWLVAQFTHGHTQAAIAEFTRRGLPEGLWVHFLSAGNRYTLTVPEEHQPWLPKTKDGRWAFRGAYQDDEEQWHEVPHRILIPIRNLAGHPIGAQFHNLGCTGSKYVWMSGAGTPDYKLNGEFPLQFINLTGRPWEEASIIGICEGVGYKAYLLAHRLGIPVIGAVGGNWASCPKQWEELITRCPGARFILYPDAGWKLQDPPRVCQNMARLATLFKNKWPKTATLQVAEWGQSDGKKGDTRTGDCDEVAIDVLNQATYLKASIFADFMEQKLKENGEQMDALTNSTEFTFTPELDRLLVSSDTQTIVQAVKTALQAHHPDLTGKQINEIGIRKINERINILITKLWESDSFMAMSQMKGELFINAIKTNQKRYQTIQFLQFFGTRLKFNELVNEIEIDGKIIDVDRIDYELDIKYKFVLQGKQPSIEALLRGLESTARLQSYHPIRDYLMECYKKHGNSKILDGLADQIFGNSDPIAQIFLIKFLIGGCARIFEPGCKLDVMYVLVGLQGLQKSQFFEVLASKSWFDDTFVNPEDKDEKIKLHSAWLIEWAELSNMPRKEVEIIKQFLANSVDNIRMPYGRKAQKLPRPSIMVGTANNDDFLKDDTGERRFWVTRVMKRIDLKWIKAHRDEIWGAAMSLYLAGKENETECLWWLTPEEEAIANITRQEFKDVDVWLEDIQNIVLNSTFTTTSHVLERLGVPVAQRNGITKKRVSSCLKSLGFESGWVAKRAALLKGTSALTVTPAFKDYLATLGIGVIKGWQRPPIAVTQEDTEAMLDQLNGHRANPGEFLTFDNQIELDE